MTNCDYCGQDTNNIIAFPHPKTGDIKLMCDICMEDMEERHKRAEGEQSE
jgi:hypothetical protein